MRRRRAGGGLADLDGCGTGRAGGRPGSGRRGRSFLAALPMAGVQPQGGGGCLKGCAGLVSPTAALPSFVAVQA